MRNFPYKRKIIYIVLIVVGIITLTGTTYAIFTTTTTQEGTNTINILKCLELELSNQKNIINLTNTYPMRDERGSKNPPYTFTLTNKCGIYLEYSIGLAVNKNNTLEDKYVKTIFSLPNNDGEPVLLTDRQEGNTYNDRKTYIFRNDGLENGESKDYKLVLWLDGTASDSEMQKSFTGNIIINTKPIKNEDQKTITVDLNGGNLLQELNEVYREGMKIKLPVPAKAGYHFDKWEITAGDATIDENNYLTIGKENITLKAYYAGGVTLTLELNGGNTTQTFKEDYGQGETITLIEPTKEGYLFGGWKIISGNGIINGSTLTMNTESVVIEAIWKKQVTLTVELNGGSTTQSFKDEYFEGDKITLNEPTKEDYLFGGWKITSGDGIINGNILTISAENIKLEATWKKRVTLTVDLNGGSTTQNFKSAYGEKDEITLTIPTRSNIAFIGWEIISGDATINNNKLIFGSSDVSIRALWRETWTFDFTGSEQTFTVPYRGVYKLEIWGAQGGSVSYSGTYNGGYGGYSNGSINLTKNEVLYINVGGSGSGGVATSSYSGGYNGGGSTNETRGTDHYHASGGGATHIANVSGILSSLSSKTSNILIVAGAGGGGYRHTESEKYSSIGGSGGGIQGTDSTTNGSNGKQGLGGYQTAGGKYEGGSGSSSIFGSFGQGGTPGNSWGSAGGGGFYGGGASNGDVGSSGNSGGGGGSGYIGNSLLSDKVMYCYNCTSSSENATKTISTTCTNSSATENCTKQGNGYARITFINLS